MITPPTPARPTALGRFLPPIALLALMWIIQLADAILPGTFTGFGVRSWDPAGLLGILVGPLLHAGWPHLIANSLPFLVLGCLVAVEGAARFWLVTGAAALVGGLGTWLLNPPGTVTVGASVLVFGYFGYVVLRTFAPGPVPHRIGYAAIALIVVGLYGASMFTGILLPGSGVSWQAHLFGAIGGGAVVFLQRGPAPQRG